VHAILASHTGSLLENVVPALSLRAKTFATMPLPVPSPQHAASLQQHPRPGGACMEGSRVFVGEMQQLLNSLRELDSDYQMVSVCV